MEKLYKEALTRISEVLAIVGNDCLSGKGKMKVLSNILSDYQFKDMQEKGKVSVSNDLYFGRSREQVSLNGEIPKLPTVNIQVDVQNSEHKGG